MPRAAGDFSAAAVVFCCLLGIKLQRAWGEIFLCTKSDFNFFLLFFFSPLLIEKVTGDFASGIGNSF